jgi:hypothetical protein
VFSGGERSNSGGSRTHTGKLPVPVHIGYFLRSEILKIFSVPGVSEDVSLVDYRCNSECYNLF